MRSGLGGSRQRSALQLSRLQTPFPFKAIAVGIGRLDSKHVCSVRPIIEAEGGIFGNGNPAFHREKKVFSLPDAQAIDKPGRGIEADRKSTRLNSSHVAISYAVFCLKKKKQCNERTGRAQKR